jgi:hypothetical protein
MKSLLPLSSVQKRKHLNDFNKTPRSSMNKQKWCSAIYGTLLMDEVNTERIESLDCNLGFEVRELIALCFCCSPVVGVEPVRRQLLDVFPLVMIRIHHSWLELGLKNLQWCAVSPSRVFELLWEVYGL